MIILFWLLVYFAVVIGFLYIATLLGGGDDY